MLSFYHIKSRDYLFYISFFILLTTSIIRSTFYFHFIKGFIANSLILFSIIVLIADQFLSVKIKSKEIIGLLFMVLLFGLSFLGKSNSAETMFSASIVLLYCARNRNLEQIFSFAFVVTALELLFIVCSSFIGLIPDVVLKQVGRNRHCLGFLYALHPSTHMFNLTAIWCYLRRKKIGLFDLLIFGILNIYFYYLTMSRTTFAMSIILILSFIFLKSHLRVNKVSKLIQGVMVSSVVLLSMISIWLMLSYSKGVFWMNKLNSVLSGRLRLASLSYTKHGVSILPRHITWTGNGMDAYGNVSTKDYDYLDNLYLQLLIHFGIIFFIIIIIALTLVLYHCVKDKQYHLSIILIFIAIHSFLDNLSMYLEFNSFLFVIFIVLLSKIKAKNRFSIKKSSKKLLL